MELTSIHSIRPQQLMVGSDRFLQVEAAVGEGVDRFVWRQARSVGVQCQMMVLVIVANAWEFLDHRHTRALEDLRITNTGALQDQRSSVRTSRDDNHLPRADGTWCLFCDHELRVRLRLGIGLVLDTDGAFVVIEQDFDHLLIADNVQVGILAAPQFRVDVPVSGVLSSTVGADILHPAFCAVVGIKVLQVLELAVAQGVCGLDEGIFGAFAAVGAAGDVDGAFVAVHFFIAVAMVGFKLRWSAYDRNIMSWRIMSNGKQGTSGMRNSALKI
jgi:hypothetical protein